jgi:hypothetical protein
LPSAPPIDSAAISSRLGGISSSSSEGYLAIWGSEFSRPGAREGRQGRQVGERLFPTLAC